MLAVAVAQNRVVFLGDLPGGSFPKSSSTTTSSSHTSKLANPSYWIPKQKGSSQEIWQPVSCKTARNKLSKNIFVLTISSPPIECVSGIFQHSLFAFIFRWRVILVILFHFWMFHANKSVLFHSVQPSFKVGLMGYCCNWNVIVLNVVICLVGLQPEYVGAGSFYLC